ncbi:MAG: hypothetical protein GEU99_06570 [Luteitalea sp.]|nr:hypothetical protein [Luteitalea sp.]
MEQDARQASANAQGGASNATRATFDGAIRKAFSSQSTLLGRAEHCSLDPQRLASIGLVVGTQLRVTRDSGQLALYTVSETRQEAVDATIRMALTARQRLGTSEAFDASVDTQVPHPTFSDAEAREHSEFVERLDDNGRQAGLVALAPHGGAIERQTDQQAERVAAILGCDRASVWCCKGFNTGGGAFERWHVTSTDIHEASFPLLNAIVGRGFAQAVSFHGFSEADVLVGGTALGSFKQEIAAALECALTGSGIEVRVARASEEYDGDNPRNIVNRISANGANGVQIEQSLEAREGFWQPIAEAVASVYRQWLPLQTS